MDNVELGGAKKFHGVHNGSWHTLESDSLGFESQFCNELAR